MNNWIDHAIKTIGNMEALKNAEYELNDAS